MSERWDAIVIGSGLGGLTTAAYLASNGLHTLVLEQYDVVGGSSHVFRRKRAFEFDVGVHYVGDCGPGGRIPTILRGVGLEGRIEFLPMDPEGFDTLVFPDLTFRVRRGWERYEEDLAAAFPDEERGLRKCVGLLRKIATQAMAGGPPSGARLLLAPLRAPTLVRWSNRTLGDLFDACGLSERARAVLAGESGTYGAPPSRASALVHAVLIDHYLREGGFYPRGGGQVIAAGLLDVIRSHGGDVRTRARVERILIEGGRAFGVRLADGEELRAPIVVSNADLKRTYLDLVGAERLSRRTPARLRRMRMSLPLFCVYLGLDVDLRERMPNTNYLLFPSWNAESPYRDCYEGRLPERPPVYLTAATVKDPHTTALAPPGCSSVQLMTIAPPQRSYWGLDEEAAPGDRRYRRQPAYRAVKAELSERMIDGAAELIPDIREHIVWQEAATPITHERYTLASGGTSYGLEHSPDQWGLRRPRWRTEIDGLFVVGASTFYAHGVLGAMLGGVACAGAVLGRDLQGEIAAGAVFADPARLGPPEPDQDPLEACRRLSRKPARIRARA